MHSFTVLLLIICSVIFTSAIPLPTTSVLPTTRAGCLYNGQFYPPGEIEQGSDGHGWCYGAVCDVTGYVFYWDNFNCVSTPLPTTILPTTPPGCFYNGQFYPPGEISSGNDGQGWCYGAYCTNYYQVIHWDNFNCISTTTLPPTTIPFHPTKLLDERTNEYILPIPT